MSKGKYSSIWYSAKVMQLKCGNLLFVFVNFHRKVMEKFERKFNVAGAIFRLNNRGNFVGFSTPQRKFAMNIVLLPVSMQNFAMYRAEV